MTSERRFPMSAQRVRLLLLVAPLLPALALSAIPAHGQVDVWVDPGHCCLKTGAKGFDDSLDPPNEADITFDVADWLQLKLLSPAKL